MSKKNVTRGGIRGVLRTHPRGFGFVIPDHARECPKDIFIPKSAMDDAVDGDHVEVEITEGSLESEKGPEGRIIFIIKRGRSHIAGTVQAIGGGGVLQVYCPILGVNRPLLVKKNGAGRRVGDRVILEVKSWGKEREPPVGEICHVLGHISDPSIDVKAAAEEFDLNQEFAHEAIEEAKRYGTKVTKADLKDREDFRELVTVTIDPTTAKDFDDAISLTKDKKGRYQLGVHIADVAAYVKPGSHLDQEAYERCNSTYFPGSVLPMLPEELSNHLCSLKPRVVRLTVSVMMDFDAGGNLLDSRIVRSAIKSSKRFTYEEAKEVLDGKTKSPHKAMLKLMEKLCLLLKEKRRARGSIDFALSEAVINVDKKGVPLGMHVVEYDITHQMVEEFMLKANETVATSFAKRGAPLVFRVHEEPTEENMTDFYELARSLGFALPPKPTMQDLQKLFEKAKNTPVAQQLTVGFIRSMKLASYSAENVGHFGLALENYCHFTSPIRRYSDLVTERLLFGELPEDVDLTQVAKKCSEQERLSFKAESSVKLLKKLRLLHRYFKEDPNRVYKATITRIKPFGIAFELEGLMLEGFIHISMLGNDYFLYNEERGILAGRHTGLTFGVGKVIEVRLLSTDFILQECRWEIPALGKRKHRDSSHKRRRRR